MRSASLLILNSLMMMSTLSAAGVPEPKPCWTFNDSNIIECVQRESVLITLPDGSVEPKIVTFCTGTVPAYKTVDNTQTGNNVIQFCGTVTVAIPDHPLHMNCGQKAKGGICPGVGDK